MKINYYVQVIKEDNDGQRVITKFQTIDEGIKFLEEIGGRTGYKRVYDIDGEYTFRKDDEFLFLEECEDRVYETFEEYMRVFDNLSEIKNLLDQKGIEAKHYGDKLDIHYTTKHCFQVSGDITKEYFDELLYERTGYRICE
ncbi:hypothetical protein VT91_08190 [Clostridium sporogenes]|uniref:hypothetical protein n=1 Tax=Clostridium botulinum TaxID=1491 RepID=UPI0007177F21|nr:hypothetical protein [Clostridium botulinum]KRU25016.1 hypothetical protein VT28_35040 [Clostridium sporogenes]KRU31909.1 hypothetical protein WG71_04150 [Clostridium sporogenes]KRU34177.1 hypothetical protein VT91_08190 [Clostridium sporogenes]KRU41194.1 hypothetical protein VT95_24210 [Clostridium sporogenes]MBZ1328218.1 hypothetical protein [Clostridium botulinum]